MSKIRVPITHPAVERRLPSPGQVIRQAHDFFHFQTHVRICWVEGASGVKPACYITHHCTALRKRFFRTTVLNNAHDWQLSKRSIRLHGGPFLKVYALVLKLGASHDQSKTDLLRSCLNVEVGQCDLW